ncbi:hypothetical protein CROQUDRAFT_89892 [Cronartium quercuum f. sp. fusiforme G11]|uniref:Uncharacterized protein n=1 Tax=Cronartium quercuum f. sp. fusiforme G11 TaxID=708437 RepID=A0A9P6NNL3_9BASI|nr:hypothetical protein CROQUDRAFT_89892 [Cronartium quercuum f. sp. fusiforme G11]
MSAQIAYNAQRQRKTFVSQRGFVSAGRRARFLRTRDNKGWTELVFRAIFAYLNATYHL